jgi:Phosphotransferase enzyme family
MELVRLKTTIPVPFVYAFDSSGENSVGLEWIVMNKIYGNPYDEDLEARLSMESKLRLHRTVADWIHQLSALRFDKIGSVYRNRSQPTNQSTVLLGPLSDIEFALDYRQDYHIPLGPYDSLRDYLKAFTEIYEAETLDPRQQQRSRFWDLFRDLKNQGATQQRRAEVQMDMPPSIYSKSDLENIPRFCQELREIIPLVVKETVLPPQSTFLWHFDISRKNLILDDSGEPIALLDWEQISTRPISMGLPLPRFITDNAEVLPQPAEIQGDSESTHGHFRDIPAERRELQDAFTERLLEIGSPIRGLVSETGVMDIGLSKLCDIVFTIPISVESERFDYVREVREKLALNWLNTPTNLHFASETQGVVSQRRIESKARWTRAIEFVIRANRVLKMWRGTEVDTRLKPSTENVTRPNQMPSLKRWLEEADHKGHWTGIPEHRPGPSRKL